MFEEEKIARIRLIRTSGMGPILFQQLLKLHGNAISVLETLPQRAARVGKRNFKVCTEKAARAEWKALKNIGGDFLFMGTPEFPSQLSAIVDCPPVISILGPNKHLLLKPTVAVVGTRYPSLNAQNFSFELCKQISSENLITVSGLARGIDSACHSGSIAECDKGGAIAVLANGVNVCYPRQNQNLYDRIAKEGLLVSELPLGDQPYGNAFPRRNRIISGLAYVVVVIEASLKSGSLITARYALEQGREVLAVPSTPADERAKGCIYLLKQGARLCTCIEDIIEAMQSAHFPSFEEKQTDIYHNKLVQEEIDEKELYSIHNKILELLSTTPTDFDMLCEFINKPTNLIRSALLDHEVAGHIHRTPGDRYQLAVNKE